MRIACWAPFFAPGIGGVEVLLGHLLPALRARGHEWLVIASDEGSGGPELYEVNGIPVRRFPFAAALAERDVMQVAALQRRVGALVREFDPQLAHLHHLGPVAFFHQAAQRRRPVPTIVTVHTPVGAETKGPDSVFVQALRAAAWVTAVSASTLADVVACVPDVAARASVIHNGVPAPDVEPAPLPAVPHVVFVGRLADEKGVDVLLRAFARVARRWPSARLTVAGDGPARVALEREAVALDLCDRVAFTGWIDPSAVPALMNTASVVVVPSRYREPFGLVAVEAARLGRPVIAARTGGLPEVVDDGITGVLVRPDDDGALAGALMAVLDDPARARSLGEAGRRRAHARFGLEACVDSYDALYRRIGTRSVD